MEQINRLMKAYWQATQARSHSRRFKNVLEFWTPPLLGECKFNYDVSLIGNKATSVIILGNHQGEFLGAWINHFFSINRFVRK